MKPSLTIGLAVAFGSAPLCLNATPKIDYIEGAIKNGSEITITGSGFGKKSNPKPYFWWNADNGPQPSKLGRKHSWDKSFKGLRTGEFTATNSKYAYKFDHGKSSGAALGAVRFSSNEIYMWRKTYEDFDATDAIAVRSRVRNVTGEFREGQTVRGQSSGATATIKSIKPDGRGRTALFFKEASGSIARSNPVEFTYGEKMVSDTAAATNREGSPKYPNGILKTFNFKPLRLWNEREKNNAYPVIQGLNGDSYNINFEWTDGTIWNSSMRQGAFQKSKQWKIEELVYKTSDIGVQDGIFSYRINQKSYYNRNIVTRTDARNAPYNIIYQSQVSNGAKTDTNMYYDSVYIDDSWNRVMICDSATWVQCHSAEIQIPQAWSDKKIKIKVNTGSLNEKKSPLYLYVFDGSNVVNGNGYRFCPSCPSPPTLTYR